MDDGIKQRLIGAIVLMALMVIFLPMFFNGGNAEQIDILIEMPEKPPIPEFDVSKPATPSELKAKEESQSPKEEMILEELKDKKVDAEGLPVSWTLQVASFKERENAEKLRDKLRDGGYKAYIKYRLDVEPRMIRVFVGPVLDRKTVDKFKTSISKQYKLDGVVVRYLP